MGGIMAMAMTPGPVWLMVELVPYRVVAWLAGPYRAWKTRVSALHELSCGPGGHEGHPFEARIQGGTPTKTPSSGEPKLGV